MQAKAKQAAGRGAADMDWDDDEAPPELGGRQQQKGGKRRRQEDDFGEDDEDDDAYREAAAAAVSKKAARKAKWGPCSLLLHAVSQHTVLETSTPGYWRQNTQDAAAATCNQ